MGFLIFKIAPALVFLLNILPAFAQDFKTPKDDYLKVETHTLHVVSAGNPSLPPIIFIHGSPGNWTTWKKVMADDRLINQFHLLFVDRPGYGESDPGKAMIQLEDQAKTIFQALTLNKSGISAMVVGHSYGGATAVEFLGLFPESVKSLLLLAPAIDPDYEKHWYYEAGSLVWPLIPNDDLKVSIKESAALPKQLMKFPEMVKPIVTVPVLYIQGDKDTVVNPKTLDYAMKIFSETNFQNIVIPNQGHSLTRQQPEAIVQGILQLASGQPKN